MTISFRPKEYFRPHGMDEAIGILSRFGSKGKAIAGGTDLLVQKPNDVECLIDISSLGLDYIKKERDYIYIGAGTAINTVLHSPVFSSGPYRVLSEAARSLATATIRNMATVGGNLCNASPAADLALPLFILDASLIAVGPKGKREILIKDFFKNINLTTLNEDELLVEVRISPSPENAGACFIKIRRHQTAIDIAVVNASTLLISKNGICEDARIALGSVAPTPIRATNAENLLIGEELRNEIIQKAAEVAAEESKPIDDIRASAAYRKKMVTVLVRRALETSIRRCKT